MATGRAGGAGGRATSDRMLLVVNVLIFIVGTRRSRLGVIKKKKNIPGVTFFRVGGGEKPRRARLRLYALGEEVTRPYIINILLHVDLYTYIYIYNKTNPKSYTRSCDSDIITRTVDVWKSEQPPPRAVYIFTR